MFLWGIGVPPTSSYRHHALKHGFLVEFDKLLHDFSCY